MPKLFVLLGPEPPHLETSLSRGKLAQMAISLSRLTGLQAFNAVGEPATLAQQWLTLKDKFKLYVTAQESATQHKRGCLFFTLPGPKSETFLIPADKQGKAKDYKKAMDSLSEHFEPRKNMPMARQAFLIAQPTAGETINNFITCLQKLAKHCEYKSKRDNQVRDHVISFKNLKAKLCPSS